MGNGKKHQTNSCQIADKIVKATSCLSWVFSYFLNLTNFTGIKGRVVWGEPVRESGSGPDLLEE